MIIEQERWGVTSDGQNIFRITLTNRRGARVALSSIGAGIVSIRVPDRYGCVGEVTLGYATPLDYLGDSACMGKVPGRCANRIDRGEFTLDGRTCRLPCNDGGHHHLHGGSEGFANRLWDFVIEEDTVEFFYTSEDGEMGYPGELCVRAAYRWDDDCRLTLRLTAVTTAATIVNLTNHAYFNLNGAGSGTALDHQLQLFSERFLETTPALIPTGRMLPVEGTPMDFRQARVVGERIGADFPALRYGKGYDSCWRICGDGGLRPAARLSSTQSGRVLTVLTTQPGVQVYTGNWLSSTPTDRNGQSHHDYDGIAIECQNFPNAINIPGFPSPVLRPGEQYDQTIQFAFGIEKL